MATRTITTRLALDGEKEFKKEMSEVNSHIKTLKSEMELAEAQFKGQANTVEALTEKDRILRREIEQQQEKVRALQQAVEDASEAYGDADKKTDGYRQSLNRAQKELIEMNRELRETDEYLDEARNSSDGFAKSIDGFGKQVDVFDDLKGSFGELKNMLVGGAVVTGIKEVTEAVFELEESTREYRQIMGTLEISSRAAGYSAEETKEAYDRLYGVLGDTQATATTIANLQATGASQQELMRLIDQTTGAWSKYGDSIPIDGLSEAINETVRTGEVTGVLADVLNWGAKEGETFGVMLKENTKANEEYNKAVEGATKAEDFFNIALGESESQQERLQLIMQALYDQDLTNLGREWRNVNEDIIKVNESQSKLDEQWARAGEMVAPLVSALKEDLGIALEGALDGLENLLEKAKEWGREAPTLREMLSNVGINVPETDGSHAGGLSYVPYDGYVAELHRGEAVLTAAENQARMGLSTSLSNPQGALTAKDMQNIMAASVNAINLNNQSRATTADIRLVAKNGTELARWILPDLRAVERSNPEVTDD